MTQPKDSTRGALVEAAAVALCEAGRSLVVSGLSPGTSGNISIFVEDRILMSPSGYGLDAVRRDDVSVLDSNGTHVDGPQPSKEVPLHLAMYRRSPSATAVVHVHSPWAVAASCLPPWSDTSALAPLTPYLVMRVGQVPLVPYAAPGSAALARELSAMPMRFRAALLAHHGSISAGASLKDAIERATEVEEAARLSVQLAGLPARALTPAMVQDLVEKFQSVWD